MRIIPCIFLVLGIKYQVKLELLVTLDGLPITTNPIDDDVKLTDACYILCYNLLKAVHDKNFRIKAMNRKKF